MKCPDGGEANSARETKTLPWYAHGLHKSRRHLHLGRTLLVHGSHAYGRIPRYIACINAVFIRIHTCTRSNGLFDEWLDCFLFHVRKHAPPPAFPAALPLAVSYPTPSCGASPAPGGYAVPLYAWRWGTLAGLPRGAGGARGLQGAHS